jgi:hypothetical protein
MSLLQRVKETWKLQWKVKMAAAMAAVAAVVAANYLNSKIIKLLL